MINTEIIVMNIVHAIIDEKRDITINISDKESSVLGSMSKSNGTTIQIQSFIQEEAKEGEEE